MTDETTAHLSLSFAAKYDPNMSWPAVPQLLAAPTPLPRTRREQTIVRIIDRAESFVESIGWWAERATDWLEAHRPARRYSPLAPGEPYTHVFKAQPLHDNLMVEWTWTSEREDEAAA